MPNSPFRIGRVVGGYAAVAAAWILVSDFLVHWLWPGLAEAEVASITKGLFFVAATSALLYYFLHRERDRAVRTTARHLATTTALVEHFRALSATVSDVVLLVDKEGRIVEGNPAALEILGYERTTLVGKPLDELETSVRFDGTDRPRSYECLMRLASGRLLPVHVEVLGLHFGKRSFRQFVMRPQRTSDAGAGARDRYWIDQFFDLPFIGMAITSPRTKHWVRFNDRLCEILGYSRTELAERTWAEITHPDDLDADLAEFEKVMRGDRDGYRMEKRFVRGDGAIVHAEIDVRCQRLGDGSVDYFVATIQDISEFKEAQARLARQRDRFAALSSVNEALITRPSRSEVMQRVCDSILHLEGVRFAWIFGVGEDVSRHWLEAKSGDDLGYIEAITRSPLPPAAFDDTPASRAAGSGEPVVCDPYQADATTQRWWSVAEGAGVRASAAFPIFQAGKVTAVLNVYADRPGWFTEGAVALLGEIAADVSFALDNRARDEQLKAALARIEEAEARWRFALEGAGHGVWDWDLQTGRVVYSREWKSMLGYDEHDIRPNVSEWQRLVHPDDKERTLARVRDHLEGRSATYESEHRLRCKDGTWKWVLDRGQVMQRDDDGLPLRMFGTHTDVQGRKQAEEALARAKERYQLLFSANPHPLWVYDLDSLAFLEVNDAAVRQYGWSRDEFLRMTIRDIRPESDLPRLEEDLAASGRQEGVRNAGIWTHLRKDGSRLDVEIVSHPLTLDGREAKLVLANDVTDRLEAESQVRRDEQRMRLAHQAAKVGTWDFDVREGVVHLHRDTPSLFGFGPEARSVSLEDLQALRHAEEGPQLADDVAAAVSHGDDYLGRYRITWPDGSDHWIEARAVLERDDAGEPDWAYGICMDVTTQVEQTRQLETYVQRLERAVSSTVSTISQIVELRDPYTAGHQRRVGLVAAAIGRELGMDDAACQGLDLTGRLHDVGKIALPAEILTKPRKLTADEFAIVKTHSEQGYQILKDVEFHWPVAEIVYQHHERLDGSGYPRGLAGDEILIETCIISIADVIESMASHRPYRAAIGIEVALEEIESNSGRLYHPEVAAAAIRLFRERGYTLPD